MMEKQMLGRRGDERRVDKLQWKIQKRCVTDGTHKDLQQGKNTMMVHHRGTCGKGGTNALWSTIIALQVRLEGALFVSLLSDMLWEANDLSI
jgi:hypothetical protein